MKACGRDWLFQVVIHPRAHARFSISGHCVRGEGNDRQVFFCFEFAPSARCLTAIKLWHLNIHEHQRICIGLHGEERGPTVCDEIDFNLPTLQQLGDHNLVDAVIFGNQDPQTTEGFKGSLRCGGFWRGALRAGDCQGEGAAGALNAIDDN